MRSILSLLAVAPVLCGFMVGQGPASLLSEPGHLELSDRTPPQVHSSSSIESTNAENGWTFRVHVNEVTIPFSVSLGDKAIDGIRPSDVRITEDGNLVPDITYFGHMTDLPLRFGMLIDSSDSVFQRSYFEEQAAFTFLHRVLQKNVDQAFVMHFTTESRFVQDLTDNVKELNSAIAALNPQGRTGMYDAVYAACKRLERIQDRQRIAKILLLISDGDDNSSTVAIDEVIAMAQKSDVVIFSASTGRGPFMHRNSRADAALRRLSDETGGRAFFVEDSSSLKKTFSALGQEMRNRYVVSYRPLDVTDDGRYHRIQLLVNKNSKSLKVLARKGYYAPHNPAD